MPRVARSFVGFVLVAATACSGSSGTTSAERSSTSAAPGSSSVSPSSTVPAGQCWSAPIAPPPAAGLSAFEDITDASNLTEPLLGMMGHAVALGDVNDDGFVDLFVGSFADRPAEDYAVRGADGPAPDRLLLGGANGFTVDDGFPGTEARTSSAAFVDLDNDGRPDLVAARNNFEQGQNKSATDIQRAPSRVYRNDGDGRFTDMGAVDAPQRARAVTAFDYDGDGLLDLLFGQDGRGGAPRLLHNDGNFEFTDITAKTGLPSPLIAFGIVAADLNFDGRTDIAIAGDNKIFLGTDDGTFRDVTPPDFAWETFGSEDLVTGIAVGDLNQDNRPDLVVGQHFNSTTKDDERVPVRVFLNRGNDDTGAPKWDDVTDDAGVPGFATKAPHVEIQDFDNDGRPDVLVTASAAGGQTPVILHNDGVQADTDAPKFTASEGLGDPQYWVSGGVADVDHDGHLDVFGVEFDAAKPSRLFRTTGPTGHWLGVDLGGTPMGGVGSLVRVFKPGALRDPNGELASAQVTASTGYGAGPAPIVHIGLGDITTVDVVVRAANGETTTMTNVTADQMVRPGDCGP